ncbi:hypothetical protein BS78_06G008500 [Paspalum vaginatum]|nr:hypothetical protein BS78_06G008500 [Paspalum vaginatum]
MIFLLRSDAPLLCYPSSSIHSSSHTIMPRSHHHATTGAIMQRVVLLLCAAAAISGGAAAAHVDTFSYPAFDRSTTQDFVAATNASILEPAALLFDHGSAFADFNRTEGFLVLSRATVDVWRAGPGGAPALEASFNTSFTLTGAAPVAFVVLNDRYPSLGGAGGLRGFANYSASDAEDGADARNASGGLASVQVGPVRSYGPENPAVGINVTVTPNGGGAATSKAVWVEYDAAAHRLSVRVAGAGDARPAEALLDAPLGLAGRRTTETALVGFFAGAIRDVVVGVRDWSLTVDSFRGDGGRKKGTAWWVVVLAVLGAVAATAAIGAAAAWYFQSRRRRRQQYSMEPKI